MPIEIQCKSCQKKYRVKDALAGRKLPCKQCGKSMSVPHLEFEDDEFGDDEWGDEMEMEPAPTLPKRRSGKKKSGKKSKSNAASPGMGKRILAILGMVFGVVIVLGGAFAMADGNMRGARGIGSGIVMLVVSFNWFRGVSNE